MDRPNLEHIAALLRERNQIDATIASITGRPAAAGHLGEWIASEIFAIALEASATNKAFDGHFTRGALTGKTVNVKWYGKREGLLDVVLDPSVDFYLVMTGPRSAAVSSRGATRPLVIDAVYLFEAAPLLEELRSRGVAIGVATSVRAHHWKAAEVFPAKREPDPLTSEQREALALFSTSAIAASDSQLATQQHAPAPADNDVVAIKNVRSVD